MTEKQLTSQIIEFLNYSGLCFCWKVNAGMAKVENRGNIHMIRLARAGTSDIQGIRKKDGKMICIEVKLPTTKKTLTSLQFEYLQTMRSYGACAGMATNCDEALFIVQGNI